HDLSERQQRPPCVPRNHGALLIADAPVMNTIRIVISLFIAVLIAVSAGGWVWTGAHQLASQAAASHVVLGLGMLAGVVGVVAIWRAKPSEHRKDEGREGGVGRAGREGSLRFFLPPPSPASPALFAPTAPPLRAEGPNVDGPIVTKASPHVLRKPQSGLFAFDDAVHGRSPGALTDACRAPLGHAPHELLAE